MEDPGKSVALNLPTPLAPVKIRAPNALPAYLENEYVVSPSTPLLSTEVQENVWICGGNSQGQLGLAVAATISEPQPVQAHERWAAISLGSDHSAGVSCDGRLYTWGTNVQGQLGNGEQGETPSTPKIIEALQDVQVRAVACGLAHTVCLTAKDVLAWGSNAYGQLGHGENSAEVVTIPLAIKKLHDVPVTQVVCGHFHSICVTASSQVYAWGANGTGQLGLGDKRDRLTPTIVDALWALPVVQLAAGEFHSVALTTNGHLFTWGSNSVGQLGLPHDADHAAQSSTSKQEGRRSSRKRKSNQKFLLMLMDMGFPKNKAELALEETGNVGVEVATEWLFSAPDHVIEQCLAEEGPSPADTPHVDDTIILSPRRVPLKSVRYVSAGSNHTVAVTSENVYSWGEGRNGALGHSTFQNMRIPTRVSALDGRKVDKVACGREHTLFLSQDGTVWGCGSSAEGQLPLAGGAGSGGTTVVQVPVKMALPWCRNKPTGKVPVAHEVVAGGGGSAFLTRGPNELPATTSVDLLTRLSTCIEKACSSEVVHNGSKGAVRLHKAAHTRSVCNGIDMVFGSAAAISAAFGFKDRIGLDVELLDKLQQGLLKEFADDERITNALLKSASQLLEDLNNHVRLLGTPERAQVLLAAAQHPLLSEHASAKLLLPRLCSTILSAPSAARHLLVKWWSDYPPSLLDARVVKPLQSYLTKELMATKKLTISVMNAIKVLARVEEANQVCRRLPPEAFYNQLISEKMDVQDHYTAWRQTQDQPVRRQGFDGPFSFCSYPFLLDARAKSNLLHIEARFQMEQTVAHARMEQQLYGSSSSRRTEEETRVFSKKAHLKREDEAAARGKKSRDRSDSRKSRGGESSRGLRNLFFNILHRRPDGSSDRDSPKSADALRRDGSMNLPKPTDCAMPGTHSDMCILRVRRHHLVEDALDEVSRQYKRDLFKPLRVHFIGEEGIDAGGVKKEFFQLLVTELLSPDYGMLVFQPESNTYWFNQSSLEGDEQFQLLGLILGLAIYNRVLLDFPLPLALYKKVLGQAVGLRELEEMQPQLGRSLRLLLQYEGSATVEETFYQTFSVEVDYFGEMKLTELKPGGENIFVTEDNRHEYVELVVDFWLQRSIRRQFDAFSSGFRILCDGPAIHLFNAQELERLVCGNPNLDFEALQKNSKYEGGFSAATVAVVWLWDIVREFELEEKKKFLKFFTGSDRSPIGGLGALKCVIQRDGPDSNKLPTSHTCFNTLLLPEYSSMSKMRNLLKLAVLNSEGFGLE